MSKVFEQVVKDDAGQIMGIVYSADPGFEAWKRERLPSSPPGNKHTYLGVFNTCDSAVEKVKGA